MSSQKVGLLSPGDMGHVVGRVISENGMPVITCIDGRSDRTRSLARKAGIEPVSTYEDLVWEADLILSILVPAEAGNAAERVCRALQR
ncbi:MAG: 6-phosphogluconate dehydrogenase, partial [Deltaproteobacteria bacterium]|nr:6-phosphogluconate dehydrogenase [Deltaproteobacteria bacterium]